VRLQVCVLSFFLAGPACLAADAPLAPNASLFLIGGAADRVLADYVLFAGGAKAHVVIVPWASELAGESGRAVQAALNKLGVAQASLLPRGATALPEGTTGVYFTGGDQSRLVGMMKPELVSSLSRFTGVIGGSSAGAMAASADMITGGMATPHGRQHDSAELGTGKGLGLLPGIVVDTHVGQRGRDVRLVTALAKLPGAHAAIGLDEDTAIYIKNVASRSATVYGAGYVRLYERGEKFAVEESSGKNGKPSVRGLNESMLRAGSELTLP
jgi:cyanophycinase